MRDIGTARWRAIKAFMYALTALIAVFFASQLVPIQKADAVDYPSPITGTAYHYCTDKGYNNDDGEDYTVTLTITLHGRDHKVTLYGHCIDPGLDWPNDGWSPYTATWNGSSYDIVVDSSGMSHGGIGGTEYCQRIGDMSWTPPLSHVELHKSSSEPDGTNGNGRYSLAGAQFNLYDEDGSYVETMTTNADGWAKSGDIWAGNYYVQEVSNPTGYYTNGDKIWIYTDENTIGQIYCSDAPKKGKISVRKSSTRPESNTLISYSLEGVVFTIYRSRDNATIGTMTTNADGYAEYGGLYLDNYYVKETYVPPSNHYWTNDNTFNFDVNEWSVDNNITINNDVPEAPKEGPIRIKKHSDSTDTESNPYYSFEGIQFAVYQLDDAGINIQKQVGTITLDKDGNGQLDGLLFTKYLVREIRGNDYYQIGTTTDYKVSLSNTIGVLLTRIVSVV